MTTRHHLFTIAAALFSLTAPLAAGGGHQIENWYETTLPGSNAREVNAEIGAPQLPVGTGLIPGPHRVAVMDRPSTRGGNDADKGQTSWGGAAVARQSAEIVAKLEPLSVRGVNYYPRETPWGGMWTKTTAETFGKDMALAASLGCNTVRTFVQFGPQLEQAGLLEKDGSATPAYLDKIESLLAAAWQRGIRLILCLEFDQQWLDARWQNGMKTVVAAHHDDGRVLMWDLMNEPDDEPKWTDATRAYLKADPALIEQVAPHHLTTIGFAYRADRLKEVGLPQVLQYHEYAGKDVFFKEGPSRVLSTFRNQRNVGGERPLIIGEFGMSTARDDRYGASPDLRDKMSASTGTEAEQAKLYEIVLAGAEQGQAAGALAWCLHDYPIRNPNESHFGLVRADGSLKPAAKILRDTFARWSAP